MQELKQIEIKAVALAWKDEAFKALLLQNPREALKNSFGVELAQDVELRVREGAQGDMRAASTSDKLLDITLPPTPQLSAMQAVAVGNYAAAEVQAGSCARPSCFCCC
jgi:ribosomally synthesized peptide (two-chain TOMM family)